MSKTPYCASHTRHIDESKVDRFLFDTLVIQWIFERNIAWFNHPEQCYLCKVSDSQVTGWLKKAAELEADVAAGGGTYTTDKLAIFRAGTETDK